MTPDGTDERYDRDWFPAGVARFVEVVEAGEILKTTEFAGAVSVTHSNAVRDAGRCRYDSGKMSGDCRTAMLLFFCQGDKGEQGLAVFLAMDGEEVRRVDLFLKPIG